METNILKVKDNILMIPQVQKLWAAPSTNVTWV